MHMAQLLGHQVSFFKNGKFAYVIENMFIFMVDFMMAPVVHQAFAVTLQFPPLWRCSVFPCPVVGLGHVTYSE